MNGDVFTNSRDINKDKSLENDNNFFLKRDTLSHYGTSEPIRHLNDYDFNILKEDAYKDISDDVLKLEYKITKAEECLKDIDNQIQAAKEILDFSTAENLFIRRKQVQEDLQHLFDMYNDASLSAKISGSITSKIKNKIQNLKNYTQSFGEKIINILPSKIAAFIEVKSSISKLENISKSVDELMTLQIPYGEASDKYEQLSKYIVKANVLQAEISNFFK